MSHWIFDLGFSLNRWLHIVATGLLLGGVVFFSFVVPTATADLKNEQQSAVFGRALWAFRSVVWFSAVILLLTGALSFWRVWPIYRAEQAVAGSYVLTSMPWALGHIVLGLIAFGLALRITAGRRLLERPLGWLVATLAVLLIVVFLASFARQWELRTGNWSGAFHSGSVQANIR